jgi:hypothetical protein
MKKITLLLALLMSSVGFSQTLPFDFSNANQLMTGDGGAVVTLTTDAGNDVMQMVGGGADWDNAQITLAENVDLSDDGNNTITFRIKPVNGTGSGRHLLKFEGGSGGPTSTELSFTTTGTDWQNISLNFPSGLGNYAKLVIFTDDGLMGTNTAVDTYLFDDIAGGTNISPPMAILPFNFSESSHLFSGGGSTTSLTTDAGDDVMQIIGGGGTWDNAQIDLAQNVDLSDDSNNTMSFRIKPINDTGSGNHLLKFEGGTGGPTTTELAFNTTGTAWQNISLDFGAGLGNYSKIVIFTDAGSNSVDTYLIDDLAGGTNIQPPAVPSAAAPNPTTADADVTYNLYSDTGGYTNNMPYDYSFGTLAGDIDLDPTATVNKALKFDFSVAGWGSGQNSSTDVSEAAFISFDYWTPNATDFKLFIISDGSPVNEATYNIGPDPTDQETITLNNWTHVEVPISHFTAQSFDVTKFLQYKFDVTSVRPGIVYIDNLFFSKVSTLSTKDVSFANVSVYPNPSTNQLNINSLETIEKISIYNLLGSKIKTVVINSKQSSIDVAGLSNGMYIVKYTVNNAIGSIKFIKE